MNLLYEQININETIILFTGNEVLETFTEEAFKRLESVQ